MLSSRPSRLLKGDHLYKLEINKSMGLRFLYILFVIENKHQQQPEPGSEVLSETSIKQPIFQTI